MAQTAGYTRAQVEKATVIAAHADKWSHGFRHEDGLRFVLFASESTEGVVYQTHINGLGCDCPRGQRDQKCWHQLAAALATEKAQEAAPSELATDDEIAAHMAQSAGQFRQEEAARRRLITSSPFFADAPVAVRVRPLDRYSILFPEGD